VILIPRISRLSIRRKLKDTIRSSNLKEHNRKVSSLRLIIIVYIGIINFISYMMLLYKTTILSLTIFFAYYLIFEIFVRFKLFMLSFNRIIFSSIIHSLCFIFAIIDFQIGVFFFIFLLFVIL